MTYKKGDGIRVKVDAMGDFARHQGRLGKILWDGPRMISSRGRVMLGAVGTADRLMFGYSVRLFSDKLGHGTEEDVTIPAESLELAD